MYEILLSDEELWHICWLVARGYFPEEAYDDLSLKDGELDDPSSPDYSPKLERVWELGEAAAWSITQARDEDPHALFACTSEPLLSKLRRLEAKIV